MSLTPTEKQKEYLRYSSWTFGASYSGKEKKHVLMINSFQYQVQLS